MLTETFSLFSLLYLDFLPFVNLAGKGVCIQSGHRDTKTGHPPCPGRKPFCRKAFRIYRDMTGTPPCPGAKRLWGKGLRHDRDIGTPIWGFEKFFSLISKQHPPRGYRRGWRRNREKKLVSWGKFQRLYKGVNLLSCCKA